MNTTRSHVVPIQAKTTSYHVNGSGRDTYISFNNGGIARNAKFPAFSTSGAFSRPASANRAGSVRLEPKTLHYHSDGTGRDQYIVANEGGLSNSWAPGPNKNFLSSLRSYDRIRPVSQGRVDYFDWAQRKMTVKEVEENRQKASTVRNLVDRLSQPKKYSVHAVTRSMAPDYY